MLSISTMQPIPRLSTLLAGSALLATIGIAPPALAGATVKINDDTSLNIGAGLRTSYTDLDNGAPNGTSPSKNFAVENARLYTSGEFGKIFKATLNFNASGNTGSTNGNSDSLRLIDGIARFEFDPAANLWIGRMLPPSDRANLYGPFFTMGWAFPGVAQNYPSATAGRDTGAMLWGDPFQGKLSYSVGVFNGHNRQAGLSNQTDSLLYAGRLEWNIWDPQTGYYRDGTYWGSKELLSIAIAGFSQSNGVGTAAAPGGLHIWSIDGIFEKKLSGGLVPTLELIRYRYSLGALDCNSGEGAAGGIGQSACAGAGGDNVGGQVAGRAYTLTGALLFPDKVGWGQFQPFIRLQRFYRDVSQTTNKSGELGLNYIIKGFNAKVSAVFTKFDDTRLPLLTPGAPTGAHQFVVGVQLQY